MRPAPRSGGRQPASRTLALAGLLTLLAASAGSPRLLAAATPEVASLLPRQAEIFLGPDASPTGPGALARLTLPPEVLRLSNPDLSDLRIFDPDGREVPYVVLHVPAPAETLEVEQRVVPRLLKVRQTTSGEKGEEPLRRKEVYELTVPQEEPGGGFWELVFETPRASFVREVEVAAARNGVEEVLLAGDSVFRLQRPARERLRLALPGLTRQRRWERLVVTLTGEDDQPLEPAFHFESSRPLGSGQEVEAPLAEIERRADPGRLVLELERPRGLVPDRLRLRTTSPAYHWTVIVWDEGPDNRGEALARAHVFRLGETTRDALRLGRPRGDQLRVVVEHGDAPPPEDLSVVALLQEPTLVFPAPAAAASGSAGVLRFGARRVRSPHYRLEELLPALGAPLSADAARVAADVYDPQRWIPARLGALELNPAFDPAPALAFALHPGATLDARRYRHRRVLTVPAAEEGLHRLRLRLEDQAIARPDLADLRVTDGDGRQWAYLLERQAESVSRPLVARGPETRDGISRCQLVPPAQPATLDRLVLDTELPFFDRAFELRGKMPGEKDLKLLARGRLRRDLGDPRPVTVSLPPSRLEELELEVQDGDDAPIRWSRIEGRFPVAEIYFAAPQGSYELLLGNPEGEPPAYELERVRNVVLSVRSAAVGAGPLEPNPAFHAAVAWTSPEGLQRVALWTTVILAVVLLTVLTLKLAREEEASEEGGE